MIPGWLQEHLRAIGADNPDGITRAARLSRCPLCTAEVLRGLDGDLAAMPAVTDTAEIDEFGEYLALIAGRTTYNLARHGGRWELNGRGFSQLRRERKAAVVPAHRCGAKIPPTNNPWFKEEKEMQPVDSIVPPF